MASRDPREDMELVERLHDLYMYCRTETVTDGYGYLEFGRRVASLMELAAGRQFEVRQVIPPPTNPRMPRNARY